jgi:hypothetical protein
MLDVTTGCHMGTPNYVYLTRVPYFIRDQFNTALPAEVPVNEQWTSNLVKDFKKTNWRQPNPVAITADAAAYFEDQILGESPALPPNPTPVCPPASNDTPRRTLGAGLVRRQYDNRGRPTRADRCDSEIGGSSIHSESRESGAIMERRRNHHGDTNEVH